MPMSDGEREIWNQMQQDAAPSREEAHGEFLEWLWNEAVAPERRAILRERIALARQHGYPRCLACSGRRRASCDACTGAGYDEPALRDLTPTEERIYRTVMSDQLRADEQEGPHEPPF